MRQDRLPPRLQAAATEYCRRGYLDDDAQIALMLEDLRHYPPEHYNWLTAYFEYKLEELTDDGF